MKFRRKLLPEVLQRVNIDDAYMEACCHHSVEVYSGSHSSYPVMSSCSAISFRYCYINVVVITITDCLKLTFRIKANNVQGHNPTTNKLIVKHGIHQIKISKLNNRAPSEIIQNRYTLSIYMNIMLCF